MEGRGEEEGLILVWLILGAFGDDVRRSSSLALIKVEMDSGSAPAALTTAEKLGMALTSHLRTLTLKLVCVPSSPASGQHRDDGILRLQSLPNDRPCRANQARKLRHVRFATLGIETLAKEGTLRAICLLGWSLSARRPSITPSTGSEFGVLRSDVSLVGGPLLIGIPYESTHRG